ncbi:uncharacterized protein LOC143203212 [Rhynchophorus ferrugineus]|uniref:Uncharacterized protein n=1 Tax=Rhynchophorus ferrugineus TaxID=354439 RepID=A0A834M4A9_RHYFE|nr:hypothetical protein GWI33_020353 [Rhynchophorus ferrugineus]
MNSATRWLVFVLFLHISLGDELDTTTKTYVKLLKEGEAAKEVAGFAAKKAVETKLGDDVTRFQDGYGNPGDLVYRYRESSDILQIRDVIVLPEISSDVQEVQWYAITRARRITSVRVLNFGRERAYTLRIDVAANEAQVILRIPPNYDPRIMIEVYGV